MVQMCVKTDRQTRTVLHRDLYDYTYQLVSRTASYQTGTSARTSFEVPPIPTRVIR